jgi:hypothetical protein
MKLKLQKLKKNSNEDINECNKERKLNSKGINQSTVSIEKKHKKLKAEPGY